jgi:general stress protein YciG
MTTSKRGFASMSLEKRTEIARKGGAAVPAEKRAFSKDSALASRAGRMGGECTHRRRSGGRAK